MTKRCSLIVLVTTTSWFVDTPYFHLSCEFSFGTTQLTSGHRFVEWRFLQCEQRSMHVSCACPHTPHPEHSNSYWQSARMCLRPQSRLGQSSFGLAMAISHTDGSQNSRPESLILSTLLPAGLCSVPTRMIMSLAC